MPIESYIFQRGLSNLTDFADIIAKDCRLTGNIRVDGKINGTASSSIDKFCSDTFNIYSVDDWSNNVNVIPNNADLNDYIYPGTYCCQDSFVAQTLLNCPYPWGNFRLFVIQNTGYSYKNTDVNSKWFTQICLGSSTMFIRHKSGPKDFSIWKKVLYAEETISSKNIANNGYIKLGELFGNLIFQWGQSTISTANTWTSVPLPIAFPSANTFTSVEVGTTDVSVYASNNKANLDIYITSANKTVLWFAIGY